MHEVMIFQFAAVLLISITMVSGTNHSSLDRHFFQNDDKNDKTHRAQNVYSQEEIELNPLKKHVFEVLAFLASLKHLVNISG